MTSASDLSLPRDGFERVLEQIESQEDAAARLTPPGTAARLWPNFFEPPAKPIHCPGNIAATYAAHHPGDEDLPPPARGPRRPDADLASVRREIRDARKVEDLRLLRRRCALLSHPDRQPEADRALAEKFMAEVNAAIDRAIEDRSTQGQRR